MTRRLRCAAAESQHRRLTSRYIQWFCCCVCVGQKTRLQCSHWSFALCYSSTADGKRAAQIFAKSGATILSFLLNDLWNLHSVLSINKLSEIKFGSYVIAYLSMHCSETPKPQSFFVRYDYYTYIMSPCYFVFGFLRAC